MNTITKRDLARCLASRCDGSNTADLQPERQMTKLGTNSCPHASSGRLLLLAVGRLAESLLRLPPWPLPRQVPRSARCHDGEAYSSHRTGLCKEFKTPGPRIAVYFFRRSNSMAVNGPVIVAFAALGGSLVGACSSIAATFMGQRLQARWARLRAESGGARETLRNIRRGSCTSVCRLYSTIGNRPRKDYAALLKGSPHTPDIE